MQKRQLTFEAIGTTWTVEATSDMPDAEWSKARQAIDARIEAFDKNYSRFRDDSLVTKMSKQAGTYKLPPDATRMLDFYKQLYDATDGKVTPLIGQVMSDAGYDAAYSLQPKTLHQPPAWDDIISYDKKTLTIQKPTMLDFGAAGKGHLVDLVSGLLDAANIREYFINAGGDIKYRTSESIPLRIGLENPTDHTEILGVATITSQSLCASSSSRRKWSKYHHIIDPVSLESPIDILSTWVVAADTMTADGLATALYFTEPAKLREHYTFSFAILRSDMSLEYSHDFPAKIYKDTAA